MSAAAAATARAPSPPAAAALLQGGDKYKEASLLYKDLLDRHGRHVAVLVGLANAYIAMKLLDDAERLLQEAVEIDGENADALVGLIAVAQAQGRPGDAATKYMPALREKCPDAPYLASLDIVNGTFERVAAAFAPSSDS